MAPAADPDPASQLKATPARYASKAAPPNNPGDRFQNPCASPTWHEDPEGRNAIDGRQPNASEDNKQGRKEMSTEPWGRIWWVGLERACEACIRAAGLVEETGRSGVAPDHGLITIRLADQPVPTTQPAVVAPSRVGVIYLPLSGTRHRMEDKMLVDDVPHVVIDTEEVGPPAAGDAATAAGTRDRQPNSRASPSSGPGPSDHTALESRLTERIWILAINRRRPRCGPRRRRTPRPGGDEAGTAHGGPANDVGLSNTEQCARRAPRVPEPRCCGCAIGCSNSASTWSAPSAASSCTCRARCRVSTRGARSPFPSGRAPGIASNASLDPRARPPSRRSCPWPALHDAHRAAYCCSTTPSPVDGVIQDACAAQFASRSHPAGGRSGPLMNDPR